MLPQTSWSFLDLFLRRRIRKRRSGRELPPKGSSVPQGNKKGRNVFWYKNKSSRRVGAGVVQAITDSLDFASRQSWLLLLLDVDDDSCQSHWIKQAI
jgi:hypothetical protein